MIVYGFFQFDRDVSIDMIQYWVLINGTLSALGALLGVGASIDRHQCIYCRTHYLFKSSDSRRLGLWYRRNDDAQTSSQRL